MEQPVEVHGVGHVEEVDEGVAHVAAVAEVDRQVEEVEGAVEALLVQVVEQHALAVLVGDVAEHEGGAPGNLLLLRLEPAVIPGSCVDIDYVAVLDQHQLIGIISPS